MTLTANQTAALKTLQAAEARELEAVRVWQMARRHGMDEGRVHKDVTAAEAATRGARAAYLKTL